MRTLVWFRGKDLRIADHVPLLDAARAGEVIPLFVVDPYFFAKERAAAIANRMRFLVASLAELDEALATKGSKLLLLAGRSVDVVPRAAHALRVDRVVAHRWSEPIGVARDERVRAALGAVPFTLYEGETLATPGQVRTGAGEAFSVFTPFSRAFMKVVEVARPRGTPRTLPPLPPLPRELEALVVTVPTAATLGLDEGATLLAAGERAARARLSAFARGAAPDYPNGRDRMGEEGTSRLSQDLKFGTVTPRAVWHAASDALAEHPAARRTFLGELMWREFAHDVLRERPRVLREPFRVEWKDFPWRSDDAALDAWKAGRTGYPVVDAAARQLLGEGFVHNRARMIAASFLCKHLLLDFRAGEAHYARHLVDGDWANNDLGWQWSAGCGVDAQPWFRVFNPVTQGQRFDADGAYVRRWIPELARMPSQLIHRPWEASADVLRAAGVSLGERGTYPAPFVDHALARGRFLAAAEGYLRPGGPERGKKRRGDVA